MDIITQLSAVGYLGKRLQLLGQEIQGLGYTLSSTDANMRSPTGPRNCTNTDRMPSLGSWRPKICSWSSMASSPICSLSGLRI